ncbi:MAG: Bug family tripartite tricarboxylate transporter substrate binding protein [Thermomicrobiales bacterium]
MGTPRWFALILVAALIGSTAMVVGGTSLRATAMAGVAAQTTECAIEGYPTENLQIMAPAAPGGGWDTTSREMQTVLQTEVVDSTVEVFNVEGAGGTIGLAQLVNDEAGNENVLMMMGLVMVGAIQLNQSDTTLEQTTPIASLTTEWEVVVVPADSEFQTLQDLIDAFVADPTAISWGGGSAGGTDHILVGLIAQAAGVDPTQVNYVPFSGGGEALAAILGGQVSAGVSGYGEWVQQIESGELRALAISSDPADAATPVAGDATPTAAVSIPTLTEQGVDVVLANWRGVVAPPEISDEARNCLISVVEQMHDTRAWQDVLAKYGWEDYFTTGDDFTALIAEEQERATSVLQELGLV